MLNEAGVCWRFSRQTSTLEFKFGQILRGGSANVDRRNGESDGMHENLSSSLIKCPIKEAEAKGRHSLRNTSRSVL